MLGLKAYTHLPVYTVLTMRTDFLGDCDLFYGLPEAMNESRYLVPRLTRQQLRQAIEGPPSFQGHPLPPVSWIDCSINLVTVQTAYRSCNTRFYAPGTSGAVKLRRAPWTSNTTKPPGPCAMPYRNTLTRPAPGGPRHHSQDF